MLCSCAPLQHFINGTIPARQCYLPIGFAIAEDSDPRFEQLIKDSVLYWNVAIGYEVFVDYGHTGYTLQDPEAVAVVMLGAVSDIESSDSNRQNNVMPCGRASQGVTIDGCVAKASVEINTGCTERTDILQTIVRHEMGHILGLRDDIDFTTLMSYKIEGTVQHPVDANVGEVLKIKQLYNLE